MKLVPWRKSQIEARSGDALSLSFEGWMEMLQAFGGRPPMTMAGQKEECPNEDLGSLSSQVFKQDSVVFSCMVARMLVFSEARFTYQRLRDGKPSGLFGTPDLRILQKPWPGGTTRDLLKTSIQHADLGGNAYTVRRLGRLQSLRPDWVEIVIGSNTNRDIGAWDVDSEILGYIYYPGGKHSGRPSVPFLANEVSHWAPLPDPESPFRGMSWLTPVIREVMADKAATAHKLAFFENAATPNMVVKLDTDDMDAYLKWVALFEEKHEGARNRGRTLFLGQGADATVVGSNFQEIDFRAVQGAGETRISAAARVPAIIVGLSEGLAAATYSNFGQARRAFADLTMRPLWGDFCGALAPIVTVPGDAELWYDESGIAFLREDQKDAAQINSLNSISMRQLVDGGFDPASVVDAITSGDLTRLVHTGLTSVQLHPPGEGPPAAADPAPALNGTNSARDALGAVQHVLALGAGEQHPS